SEPGLGTTFKVYLPRVGSGADLATTGDRTEPAERGSETILIVEDEDMVRTLACRALREQGYAVLEARTGADALRQLQARPSAIDLVITDVVMPEMGGRELGRRLKATRPSLPLLFMSGYTGEDVIQRGLMDADSAFQQKPFAPTGLARKVREILDQTRARLGGG
ncbi:MAG: response regulator, partial [Gemmatimonadales bacterium]